MRPYCLRRCGKFNHRSTTFDWGFGEGSMECVWDADCSYVNQTTPSEETTSPATTTEAVKPTVTTTVKSTTNQNRQFLRY